MFFCPHKLFLVTRTPMSIDAHGDPIQGTETVSVAYLCDCFLHDVETYIRRGYSGMGMTVKYYVNVERRMDFALGQEVIVYENDGATVRGDGRIVDVKHTGRMQFGGIGNYTTIYI